MLGGGTKKPYLLAADINGSSGVIKYNISTLVKNYSALTKDNILIVPKKVFITFLGGRHNDGQWHSAEGNINVSYTPSDGQLTISGNATVGGGDNGAYLTSVDIWIVPT